MCCIGCWSKKLNCAGMGLKEFTGFVIVNDARDQHLLLMLMKVGEVADWGFLP